MKKKNGQALVEFVIALPILLLLILGFIDLGKVIYFSSSLENKLEDVVTLYQGGNSIELIEQKYLNDEKIVINITNNDEGFSSLELKKEVDVITPGLNLIINNPYEIKTSRVIKDES